MRWNSNCLNEHYKLKNNTVHKIPFTIIFRNIMNIRYFQFQIIIQLVSDYVFRSVFV